MKSTETLWRRAEQYLRENQIPPARAVLETILARDPNHVQAYLTLGGIAWKQDRIRQSVEYAVAASRSELISPDLVCDVIAALIQTGAAEAASRLFDHPALKKTQLAAPLLMRLSGQAQANGEHARALEFLERARRAGAEGADFLCYLGVQLTFNGRLDEAERELEHCVRLKPAAGRAGLILSRMRTQSLEHNHLRGLDTGLRNVARGTEDHAALEFARYKELEDQKRYAEAWNALTSANQIMHSLLRHDPEAEAVSFAGLIDATSAWAPMHGGSGHEGPTPIFIVGMPRSGTTLLDRILGNHSLVANAGELSDFGRQVRWAVDHCTPLLPDPVARERLGSVDFAELGQRYLQQTQWRAGNRPYYVDKLPANWMVAGLIARALPSARILNLIRDPMDVCFSNYRAMFGDSYPYSYDLASLARHYLGYCKVMLHWHRILPGRIMDVSYHELVGDPEGIARRVLDFCGLEYEPGCADITRNPNVVATLSMVQARQTIHARSVEQWRPYAEWLKPLQSALAG